jgi:hypothetical protein
MSTIIHAGTSQPYVPGGAERSIREQGRLLAAYRRHHGQILKDYLAGPYGPAIRAILDALKIRPIVKAMSCSTARGSFGC